MGARNSEGDPVATNPGLYRVVRADASSEEAVSPVLGPRDA